MYARVLRRIASDLRAVHARFALVGGLAVSSRAEPRFTRDVDFAVAVRDDAEAERIVHDLMQRGYRLRAQLEQDEAERLATVRLECPPDAENVLCDLLFASAGIEPEVVDRATAVQLAPGLQIPVALTGHLIALKTLSVDVDRRPQDVGDLRELLVRATEADIAMARSATRAIEQRGYRRDRQPSRDLERFIAIHRPDAIAPE